MIAASDYGRLRALGGRRGLRLAFACLLATPAAAFAVLDNSVYTGAGFLCLLIALVILASILDGIEADTIWVWGLGGIFLFGYVIKFYYFRLNFSVLGLTGAFERDLRFLNIEMLSEAFFWATVAFLETSVVYAALKAIKPKSENPAAGATQIDEPPSATGIAVIALATYICGFACMAIASYFGFGQMGRVHNKLPFRLDAFITNFNYALVPCILVMLLLYADQLRAKRLSYFLLISFTAFSIIYSVFRGSRMGVSFALQPVLAFWLILGRTSRRKWMILGGLLLVTIVGYPVFSAVRGAQISNTDIKATAVLTEAMNAESSFLRSIEAILTRVSGLEGLAQNMSSGADDLSFVGKVKLFLFRERVADYQTYDVVGIDRTEVEGRSIGFLGYFYAIGGRTGVLLGVPLTVIIIFFAWRYLSSTALWPVNLTLATVTLFNTLSEGFFTIEVIIIFVVTTACMQILHAAVAQKKGRVLFTRTQKAIYSGYDS